ncbi:DUF6631 family protein [Stenotrophomonas forensis]|uniref:DUF6631 family protein n=1 Tax=Stenotrophomonas forensis TaxID=2871169 RepID=UPI0018D3585B|nr:hypothetical protein [Stenotrophomonas maltophilia]MBH1501871.1 hypothetical protein [Stenotrophomonas maltophilia]MBH1785064.1 hypothetical protein [Stenotrophomonas maltophilia]
MAKKVERKQKEAPTEGASASQPDELSILHPERTFTLAGREVTMREYGHIEGLRLLAWAKPFADDLYAQIARGSHAPSVASMAALLSTHADLVRDMVAQAASVESAWVEGLGDVEGDLLVMSWWEVNAGFFIRRLLARAAAEKLEARQRAGAAYTTSSSQQGTAAPPPTSDA